LSGSDAQTGESLLDGLELGARSVGPGPPVQIRVLDGEGEPGPTVRRCRELVDDPGQPIHLKIFDIFTADSSRKGTYFGIFVFCADAPKYFAGFRVDG
jgi:hypothetical protein